MTEPHTKSADESPAEWAAKMSDAELSERVVSYCGATLPRAVAEEIVKRLRGGCMHNAHWLDLDAVRKRTNKPVPIPALPGIDETIAQRVVHEFQNGWISEWNRDRDLRRALDEIEMLRKLALLTFFQRLSAARAATRQAHAAQAALDGELEKLIAFVRTDTQAPR